MSGGGKLPAGVWAALRRLERAQGLPPGELTSAIGALTGEALLAAVSRSLAQTREYAARAEGLEGFEPEARTHVTELVALLEELLQRIRSSQGGRPAAFAPPALTVLSDPHTQAGVRSMWAPLEWQRPDGGAPFYKDKNLVLVYAKDAADIVLSLDEAKANAFLICLGKWFAETSGDPAWPRDARVYVEDILAFRGIKKHSRGGYEVKQKEAVKEDILALRHLWVRSHQQVWETTRAGKRKLVDVDVDDPLVEVSVESTVDLWGERTPYALRFRPGGWARHYLGGPQHWTTSVLKTVMRYDARYDRIKLRLGIYLAFQWRIREHHDNHAQPWRLKTLLEGAKLEIPKRNPQRFFPQVVQALAGLKADGVLATCEAMDFPDWRPPADEPPKSWVPKLLNGRWRLLPAATGRDELPAPVEED